MTLEARVRKAEKCVGTIEGADADVLTDEELEELRTALRMALGSGVPLMLPADHIAGGREQVL